MSASEKDLLRGILDHVQVITHSCHLYSHEPYIISRSTEHSLTFADLGMVVEGLELALRGSLNAVTPGLSFAIQSPLEHSCKAVCLADWFRRYSACALNLAYAQYQSSCET